LEKESENKNLGSGKPDELTIMLNSDNDSNQGRSSYRQIFKATSLFGGVQVFQILSGIVRTKFVAVLLGTSGVGIMGLLNSPLQLILAVTGLGITFSAVRDISEAYGNNDVARINKIVTTLRRWSWFAGILGVLVTVLLAPFLSQWTFGNSEYTWAFLWLSITMLMQTISNGQKAVIQASRRLKDLAKASVYGSLIGLVTAIPLYYYFGLKGIVPSLIIVPLTGLILSWYYSRKIDIKPVKMSWKETLSSGENMIKLGLVITVTGIIGFFTGYVLNAFIGRTGGVDQVGLYNAGWSVIGQSTGLVFAAMTTDYFPRLSSINKDDAKITTLVNQQAEMVLLILGPILILLIGTMSILIRILYTPAFLPVVLFANWMLLGILLKGLVWPVGFIFPAKGDLKVFGLIEVSAMTFNIFINIMGYYLYGLEGLGISFLVGYLFGLGLTMFYAKKKYGFRYNKLTIRSFVINLLLVTTVFATSYFLNGALRFSIGALVLLISAGYSLNELNKKLDLRHLFNEYLVKRFR
jgi:O-antigen/teichoic acid export membrane protein